MSEAVGVPEHDEPAELLEPTEADVALDGLGAPVGPEADARESDVAARCVDAPLDVLEHAAAGAHAAVRNANAFVFMSPMSSSDDRLGLSL